MLSHREDVIDLTTNRAVVKVEQAAARPVAL